MCRENQTSNTCKIPATNYPWQALELYKIIVSISIHSQSRINQQVVLQICKYQKHEIQTDFHQHPTNKHTITIYTPICSPAQSTTPPYLPAGPTRSTVKEAKRNLHALFEHLASPHETYNFQPPLFTGH